MTPVPKEIRAARAFLMKKGERKIRPRLFAGAAKELDIGFAELMRYLGRLRDQGRGQTIERRETMAKEAGKK